MRKPGRPEVCRKYGLISGVLTKKCGRKNSLTFVVVNSVRYSVSSCLLFRHVKYVYDCEKPSFASRYIIFGRVNASDRKMTSGYRARTSANIHSQNGSGLVCGL